MKITKSTIIRTVMLLLVILNLILKAFGLSPISADEGEIGAILETVLEIAVIVAGFWYNNSFSEKARKADEFLKKLYESEE